MMVDFEGKPALTADTANVVAHLRVLLAGQREHEGTPVYRSDLFHATPDNSPQLRIGRQETMQYEMVRCPVAERAAYEEAVWLPQFLLLGGEEDVRDIARAAAKVIEHIDELAGADPALAGIQSMSRAERPRIEKKNY